MDGMVPTLHSHPLASLCWKVTIGLRELNAPFKEAIASIGDLDQTKQFAKLWAVDAVPILKVGRDVLTDSTEIIEKQALLHTTASELIPVDSSRSLETHTWDRICDTHLHAPAHKIVAARLAGEPDPREALDEIATSYALIEDRMRGRQWIGVSAFSLADCSAGPGLWLADKILPLDDGWPAVRAYLDRLMARPAFAELLTMAEPYVQLFPQPRREIAA
jgi:glutathione S-transferase